MPRNISVRRKYFPALSIEDSLPSSQRSFRGSRKPWGGGPAGVAPRREALLKVADGIVVRVARKALRGAEVGRARASIIRERAEAMAVSIVNNSVAMCETTELGIWVDAVMKMAGTDWLQQENGAKGC